MKIAHIRKQFPILSRRVNGRPLVYFDNASTTQKPASVLRVMDKFYRRHNANIHRGIHTLSQEATAAYERVRNQVQKFLGAKYREEIVFTSGATEALNLVAFGLSAQLRLGDEILLSEAEHHSNIVPWQVAAQRKSLRLKYVPVAADGRLDLHVYKKLLTAKARIVSITYASNVTGAITPLAKMIPLAHRAGALVIVDAAQAAAHLPINVQKLDCDFLVFSGHKMYGPTGVGVLYGKRGLLEKLPPSKFGGHMIEQVTKEKTAFAPPPQRFEGGTMPIAEVTGLGAAIGYLQKIGFDRIQKYEHELTRYALQKLKAMQGLNLIGPKDPDARLPVLSFTLAGAPAHDIASILDNYGIAVRSGHHCAQILHQRFQVSATARISLGVYNTKEEIDKVIEALMKVKGIFKS